MIKCHNKIIFLPLELSSSSTKKVRLWDKRIVPENEFSDSDEEGLGGRNYERSYRHKVTKPGSPQDAKSKTTAAVSDTADLTHRETSTTASVTTAVEPATAPEITEQPAGSATSDIRKVDVDGDVDMAGISDYPGM